MAYPKVHLIIFDISIHALHEESDRLHGSDDLGDIAFQSTLSMRRATNPNRLNLIARQISIHALHEESDCFAHVHWGVSEHFNPRSP